MDLGYTFGNSNFALILFDNLLQGINLIIGMPVSSRFPSLIVRPHRKNLNIYPTFDETRNIRMTCSQPVADVKSIQDTGDNHIIVPINNQQVFVYFIIILLG